MPEGVMSAMNQYLGTGFWPDQHADHWDEGEDLKYPPATKQEAPQHLEGLRIFVLIWGW